MRDVNFVQSKLLESDITDMKFYVPMVKSLDARIGFNGSTKSDTIYGYLRNEDHYGLTLKLNSFQEIKSQKLYKKAVYKLANCESKLALEKSLKERYDLIANIYYTGLKLSELSKLSFWLAQKDSLYNVFYRSGLEINVKDVIKLEVDKRQFAKDKHQMNADLKDWYRRLSILTGVEVTIIDTGNFIPFQFLLFDIQNLCNDSVQNVELSCRDADISLADARVYNVKSQGTEILDGFSIGYQEPLYLIRPNKFNTLNNFSLRVSLKWPIKSNNNFRVSRAKIDLQDSRSKWYNTQFQVDQSRALLITKLQVDIEYYHMLSDELKKGLVNEIIQKEGVEKVLQPIEWIELNTAKHQFSLNILEVQRDILLNYLKLLQLTGKLIVEPPVNYLSSDHSRW